MTAKHWIRLFVVALALLLGWLMWKDGGPEAEEVRLGPAVVAGASATAGRELESLREPEVVGERLALGDAASPAPVVAAAGELFDEESGGHRSGLWVKVVDEQHAPIGDVRVVLRVAAQPRGKPEAVGTSAADGRVWLAAEWGANPSERRVEPAGPGAQVDGVTFDPAQLGDEPVLLVLSAGAGLDVHVIDEGGASAEGAQVRLVSPADYDGAFGRWDAIDAAVMAEGRVQGGVCSFARLPADTDLLVQVRAAAPLGIASLRTRTPSAGQRASVEARYSADDVVLHGELSGELDDADWGWSLFDPAPVRAEHKVQRERLDVGTDGRFVVRLGPEIWRDLGPAVCLVLYRGPGLLEAVELPSPLGAGSVALAPVDTTLSTLCAGRLLLEPEGSFDSIQLGVLGSRSPSAPKPFFAADWAYIDSLGNYWFGGRVPTTWRWELTTPTPGWKVAEPTSFQPGDGDHDVALVGVGGRRVGRLVPGPRLAAADGWYEHVLVRLNERDGSQDRIQFVDPDGSFELSVPLEKIQSISVFSHWHDRPVLEWHVVPGAPLAIELPVELRLVALDVRGSDGAPHKATALDPPGEVAFWFQRSAESPLVLLLDRPSHDVIVRGDGYRDVLLTGVVEDQRVDLVARAVPLVLQAVDLPELPADFRLRPILARGPKAAPHSDSFEALDSGGRAAVQANGLGDFYVHLQVEQVASSTLRAYLLDGEMSPRIHVREPTDGQRPAELTLTFDRARILEALAKFR